MIWFYIEFNYRVGNCVPYSLLLQINKSWLHHVRCLEVVSIVLKEQPIEVAKKISSIIQIVDSFLFLKFQKPLCNKIYFY